MDMGIYRQDLDENNQSFVIAIKNTNVCRPRETVEEPLLIYVNVFLILRMKGKI